MLLCNSAQHPERSGGETTLFNSEAILTKKAQEELRRSVEDREIAYPAQQITARDASFGELDWLSIPSRELSSVHWTLAFAADVRRNYEFVSTGLTRARRSQTALDLDPLPASKVQSDPHLFAEIDKRNCNRRLLSVGRPPTWYSPRAVLAPDANPRRRKTLDTGDLQGICLRK